MFNIPLDMWRHVSLWDDDTILCAERLVEIIESGVGDPVAECATPEMSSNNGAELLTYAGTTWTIGRLNPKSYKLK
jgi:hypothetical protein